MKAKEFKEHPLISAHTAAIGRVLLRHAKNEHRTFEMIDFAITNLLGSASAYADAPDASFERTARVRDLSHAAVLFVYEALRKCDIDIIKQWPEFDEMLKCLVYLDGDLP